LGDFFAKKSKKKVKASNLNIAPATQSDEPKRKKDADEEGWAEEQVVGATLVVQAVGNLSLAEEKEDEDDSSAPAWGQLKTKATAVKDERDQRRFPTLAKAIRGPGSNINIDDGSNAAVNIKTSRNAFAELGDEDDNNDRRPSELKPAMIQKKKGERETTAIRREVDRHAKDSKKKKRKEAREEEEEEGSDEDESEDEDEVEADEEPIAPAGEPQAYKEEPKKKKKAAKADEIEDNAPVAEDARADDVKIAPNDDEKTFTIEVDKSDGESFLGITWKVTVAGLEILTIGDGLIAKLNEDAENTVAVFDRVVSVNDDGDTAEMVQELKKSQSLELEIVRPSAVQAKYKGRRRLPPVSLAPSEQRDAQKENKPAPVKAGARKKKFASYEEDKKSKLVYLDE